VIKKLIVWSLVATGVVFAVNSVRPGAVHTFFRRAHAKFERNIPPEFELERIKDQIAKLTPDMNKNISVIAEELVKVKGMERRIDDLQARLETSKNTLALMTDAIQNGHTRVSLPGGREVSVTQVKSQLNTCKNLERELTNVKKIYEAKKSGVDAARQQLAEMKQQKEQLEVMAAEYEAELKTLALEQTRSKLQLDDSRLAEIKESFERLRERIEVARTTANLAEQFKSDSLTTEKKPAASKDVLDEAREYLGADKSKIDAAGK